MKRQVLIEVSMYMKHLALDGAGDKFLVIAKQVGLKLFGTAMGHQRLLPW
jgi:hypothetical protein